MSSELASSGITQVHGVLLDQLSLLDRLGEHVAAAHLAAAIDAIEEQLDDSSAKRPRDRKDDPVETMANALVARLHGEAPGFARRQMEGASGQTLLIWAAIASRIDAVLAKRA